MAIERMREGGEFPRPQVRSKKQYALAAGIGAFVVFETVVNHYLRDILGSVAGEETHLGKLTSQGREFSPQDLAAFRGSFVGKCDGEIPHAYLAKPGMQQVDGLGEGFPGGSGQRTWKRSDGFSHEPQEAVLKPFA